MMRSLVLMILGIYLILNVATGQVVINEFMASNDLSLLDEDGNSSDWIELYNTGTEPEYLDGYFLSDDSLELQKWALPPVILSPGNFLLIFCSGKDQSGINVELHANFKIASVGEVLFFSGPSGEIQVVPPVALKTDQSYAAFPDGSSTFFVSTSATPFSPNLISPLISFSPKGGFFDNPVHLEMTSLYDDLHSEIRYTTDGSLPTAQSPLVDGQILIEDRSSQPDVLSQIPTTPDYSDWTAEPTYPGWFSPATLQPKSTVVRSAVFKEGIRVSEVFTQSYFVFHDALNRYSVPVLSLSCDPDSLFGNHRGIYVPGEALDPNDIVWTGNYFQDGEAWEREVNVEYFVAGERVINQMSGLRIHGGKTRGAAQKTMKLFARSEYGKKEFDFPFFPAKEQSDYKRLLIRTSMGAWGHTILADAYAHQACKGLHFDIQEYQPIILFINGEYWGLQELREKTDRFKLAEDHGLDQDAIRIYGSWGGVIEGVEDVDFYNFRDGYLVENDITDPAVFAYVETRLDIDNIIDYFFAELYFHNADWPANNLKMWRSNEFDNRWRWLFYDLDGGFGNNRAPENNLKRLLSEEQLYYNNQAAWSTFLIRTLIKNETFRNRFIDRGKDLLQNHFSPAKMLQLLEQMQAIYEPELPAHFQRWPNWLNKQEWLINIEEHIRDFVIQRPCELEKHMMDYFGIDAFLKCEEVDLPEINLFPNPTSGDLNLAFETLSEGAFQFRIVNSLGQVVLERWVYSPQWENFDLSRLPGGLYFIVLEDAMGKTVKTTSVVKY